MMDAAEHRKTKLELGGVPVRREVVTGLLQLTEHIEKILPQEMRQHETVVQRRAPAHEFPLLWLAPQLRDQRADQEWVGGRDPRVGRHLERVNLDETKPAGRTIG